MPRKKKQVDEETWSWKPEEEPTEETPFSDEEAIEVPEEEPKKLYPVQVKFGLEKWQDTVAAVELLGTRAVEIDNHIAVATATVRGGWRFFESDGVMFKLRETDWQSLLA